MRRVLPAAVALMAAAAGALVPVTSSSAAGGTTVTAARAAPQVRTPFVMGGVAFGTSIKGSAVPAGSAQTGYQVMGCNKYANKARTNFVASVAIPGLGTVDGVRSRLWTAKKGNRTSSFSRHTIAGIDLLDTPLGTLSIGAVDVQSEAFNVGGPKGTYGNKTTSSVAKIVFTPTDGAPTTVGLPLPGVPITIPGVAKIAVGAKFGSRGSDFAVAGGTGLKITLLPTGTTVIVGKTRSTLALGKTRALFNGYGAGVAARILGDVAQIGRTANQPLSCTGTDGKTAVKKLVGADLSPLAEVGATSGTAFGVKGKGAIARARTTGSAADVVLLDGALKISVATGVAQVQRTAKGKLKLSAAGTRVGTITANGDAYHLDPLGELEIPGIAKLEGRVIERLTTGLKVVGLRITLLDGSLGVVDLGVALAKVRPTKRT